MEDGEVTLSPVGLRSAAGRAGAGLALALVAAVGNAFAARAAPVPDREAWRKVESGSVTVVGTASDAKLVETAATLRALTDLLPGLLPGVFGPPPPVVVAIVHDAADLGRVGLPVGGPAGGRVVLSATSDEEARPGLLRAVVVSLAARAKEPIPPWLVTGLAEYLSTFSAAGGRATLGRAVPEHVARLRVSPLPPGRPELFVVPHLERGETASAVQRAEAWCVVHELLQGVADGEERLALYVRLLAKGRDGEAAFREAFDGSERAVLARARTRIVESRPLARPFTLPEGSKEVGRVLPLTRAGAAGVLGGLPKGRRAPGIEAPASAGAPGRVSAPPPVLSSAVAQPAARRDVPAEVDLVNRLIDEGREEEALSRLEALHASLGRDPEMQRALGWDVQEVRRVVVHNRLIRRYNEAIGLLNAGRLQEAIPLFREVAASAEDPGLRRLAWERATAPNGGRR